jgi:hypothetical protein
LLRLGLGAGAVLAAAGYGVAIWSPGLAADGRLGDGARQIFSSVASAVLEGNLPEPPAARQAALVAHLARVQTAIGGLPPATRKELSDLLALLSTAPGRLLLTGLPVAWADAETRQTQAALQTMRRSSSQTRQQVYQALRELTVAAYFSDASTWPQLGYPGPLKL